jgi:hypothetical protein
MGNDSVSFGFGVLTGFFLLLLLVLTFNFDPPSVRSEVYKQAVDLGYGRWMLNTNNIREGSIVRAQFQWITNSPNIK